MGASPVPVGEQQQAPARNQVVGDQRAGGLAGRPGMVSPSLIFCSREVKGPSATLMLKNSSSSS